MILEKNILKDFRQLQGEAEFSLSDHKRKLDTAEKLLAHFSRETELYTRAQAFFTEAANKAQAEVSGILSTTVTSALRTVFGNNYEFRLDFVKGNVYTEAKITLLKRDHEVDPMGNSGLSVANVIAIAMRLALIILEGGISRVMILDEPTASVMVRYQPVIGQILKSFCDNLGFQVIVVTHHVGLAEWGDKIYYIKSGDNGAEILEVSKDEIRTLIEEGD